MGFVLRYTFRYEGVEGFLDRLGEMASKYLRDCGCVSFENFVARLFGKIDLIILHHSVDLRPVHGDVAIVTEYFIESIIDYSLLDRAFTLAAEELDPDCVFFSHEMSPSALVHNCLLAVRQAICLLAEVQGIMPLLIRDNDFCRPVASSEFVTESFQL